MSLPRQLRRITDTVWELPVTFKEGMRVPARIIATESLLAGMEAGVFEQVANVACLPGILNYACCMPDGHWGYGFPIGGVAAMDPATGVISPGGIGFDINCGMRLCLTNLTEEEVQPRIRELVDQLFSAIPTGVGCTGFVSCSRSEFRQVIEQGSRWCLKNGYALPEDLEMTEEGGCFAGADADACSDKAIERGYDQIGTLGSGNHYLRDPGGPTGEHLRRSDRPGLRHHHPQPGGDHVPLRQPRLRPPGGHRLPADLSEGHDRQIRHQAVTTGNWPAPRSAPPRARPTSRP